MKMKIVSIALGALLISVSSASLHAQNSKNAATAKKKPAVTQVKKPKAIHQKPASGVQPTPVANLWIEGFKLFAGTPLLYILLDVE